ncbi:hypothetical protein HID58_036234, partial [Brassica napus]
MEEADTESEADKSVDATDIAADVETSSSIDQETKSFIEGLVHSSVSSLGDILRAQMARFGPLICQFLGRYTQSANGEYREHVQREDRQHGDRGFTAQGAISLSAEGSVPKSKPMTAPKTKSLKLLQRKRSIKLKLKLQQRK